MSWDQDAYARSIITDLAKLKPLGDFVLVHPLSLDDQLKMEDRHIAPSPIQMTKDGRYVSNRPRGLRYGRVVAMGAGDKVIVLVCQSCDRMQHRIERGQDSKKWRCSECGSFELQAAGGDGAETSLIARAPMNCTLGDVVAFHRVPANEISINGQEFVMCHEEQHIVAVLDQDSGSDFDPARQVAAKSIQEPVYA